MFCNHCGSELPEGAAFCVACGQKVAAPEAQPTQTAPEAQPAYAAPEAQPAYAAPEAQPTVYAAPAATDAALNDLGGSILKNGILGLAFGTSGFFLAFLGIIFGAKAGRLAGEYQRRAGMLTGKAKVGSILGKIGKILGIIMTVCMAILLLLIIVAAGEASSMVSYLF